MLSRVLDKIQGLEDPRVLVGFDTADDAGVYQLDEKTALIQTADFFTPIVDDPYQYGEIAAANALSDVYAMGGLPLYAIALVGFPVGNLGEEVLREILAGGTSKMKEARVPVIGGHSVKDPELKFGYAVTGRVDPGCIYTNDGALPGDQLFLTKPLGTGIISTAIKAGKCPQESARAATDSMLRLNRESRLLRGLPVHALTDITGFGLLGHAFEVALNSGVCLHFQLQQIPFLPGVRELASRGFLPAGIESNRKFVGEALCWGEVSGIDQAVLLDPQTSGGLLISVDAASAVELRNRFLEAGREVVCVGEVLRRKECYLQVSGSA